MKDKLKVTYAKDGHKVITHSKPLSRKKQSEIEKIGVKHLHPDLAQRKRITNYWQRRANILNMPVVFYLLINVVLLFLVITSIIYFIINN